MLVARANSTSPGDGDLYLARLSAGSEQWDTIERIDALSEAGHDERSVFAVPALRRLFFVRDGQIWEAQWVGDDLRQVAWSEVHPELDGADADKEVKAGVWVSPEGSEIWFSSDRSGAMQLYRAVRAGP
jgi:hypothetical protein